MRRLAVLLLFTFALRAQEKTFRSEFDLAQKAAEAKDAAGYLSHMQAAMELEHDRAGRPFYQYNLARAYAMNGRTAEAIATLETAWKERVEGPMIGFADKDPAFDSIRKSPGYERIHALFDSLAIETVPAGGAVHELLGAGCNLAASIGPDGVLLVDSGYPGTSPSVKRAIAKVARGPARIRFVVDTHGHFDHAASNHAVDPDAVVIAHRKAAEEMKNESDFVPGFRIPGVEAAAIPDVTIDRDLDIRFNGEQVHVIALPAHTAGDLVVWFEGSKVLHLGDDYFGADTTRIYPGSDPASFFATLGELLRKVPDDTVVISGHAARVPASKLKESFELSKGLYDLVRESVLAGKTNEDIVTAAEAKGHPRRWIEFYLKALRR